MIRLFTTHPLISKKIVPLTDKQTHYLLHVMRCRDGQEMVCFNGVDGEWSGFLRQEKKKSFVFDPQKQLRPQNKPTFCALCPALIKKDNFDWVLQKATELNVTDIYPFRSERSVVSTLNMERATAILSEAAEQSERLTLPNLHSVCTLPELIEQLPSSVQICYLSERGNNLGDIKKLTQPAFIVGPEGGFTEKELQLLAQHSGAISVNFPETILRAETASIAAISCWQLGSYIPCKK